MADIQNIKISELTSAPANETDLIEVAQYNSSSSTNYVSRKTTLSSVSSLIADTIEYTTELDTTAKTLIGAINELKQRIDNL